MSSTHAAGFPVNSRRNGLLAWIAVATVPLLLVAGFLGTQLVGDPNDPSSPHGWSGAWRVLVLSATLEVIPVLGIVCGARPSAITSRAGAARSSSARSSSPSSWA